MCIKELRKMANLTQGQLAVAIGVSQPAVARWESGVSDPSYANLRAMAALLGCTLDELAGCQSSGEPPAEAS